MISNITLRVWESIDGEDLTLRYPDPVTLEQINKVAEHYVTSGKVYAAHVLVDDVAVSRHFSQQFKTMLWEATGKTVEEIDQLLG